MMKNICYKKSRKGQFAMEFMMTYGWAILVVLTIISALLYFTPNIKTITGKRCTFGPATPCIGSQLTDEYLTIALRNAIVQKMYIVSAVTTFPVGIDCELRDDTDAPIPLTSVPSGDFYIINADQRFRIRCENDPAMGGIGLTDDSNVRITVTYKKSSTGFDQISEGDIYAKMQS